MSPLQSFNLKKKMKSYGKSLITSIPLSLVIAYSTNVLGERLRRHTTQKLSNLIKCLRQLFTQ